MSSKSSSSKSKKKPSEIKTRYPDRLPVTYANHVKIFVSKWDITIDFGLIGADMWDSKKIESTMTERIIMSPQHAKQFVKNLSGVLENYEKDFGPLHLERKSKKKSK
jgi:hypothetical protein